MKIGVDLNISVENLLKDSGLTQDVNASEFDALLSSLITKLENGEINLEDLLSGDQPLEESIETLLGGELVTADQLVLREIQLNPQVLNEAIEQKIETLVQNIDNELSSNVATKVPLQSQIQEELNPLNEAILLNEEVVTNVESLLATDNKVPTDENMLVKLDKLRALLSANDTVEYQKVEVLPKVNEEIILQEVVEEEIETGTLPEISNVFELQLNQFQRDLRVDSQATSDVAVISNSLQAQLPLENIQSNVISATTQLTASDVQFNQFNIVNAIKSQLQTSTSEGLHKLTVRLHPEELGRINIELNMKDGIVSGVIRINEDQAKAVFTENLEVIKNELQSQGIKVESLDINLSNDNSNSSAFRDDSFRNFRENREQRNFRNQNNQDDKIEAVTRKRVNNIYREEGRVNMLI